MLADESCTPKMLAIEAKYHEVGKIYIYIYVCWDVTVCSTQPSWHTLHSVQQLAGDQHLAWKHLRCLLNFWHRQWGLLSSLSWSMGSLCTLNPFPWRKTSTWQNCGCSRILRMYLDKLQGLNGISNCCHHFHSILVSILLAPGSPAALPSRAPSLGTPAHGSEQHSRASFCHCPWAGELICACSVSSSEHQVPSQVHWWKTQNSYRNQALFLFLMLPSLLIWHIMRLHYRKACTLWIIAVNQRQTTQ